MQYADFRLANALFSSRLIRLPRKFQKILDSSLRDKITASLKIPFDWNERLIVEIADKKEEISESDLKKSRADVEKAFIYDWNGRGKVIFKKDKELFEGALDELKKITAAYQDAVKKRSATTAEGSAPR